MISTLYGSYPRTPLSTDPFRLKKSIEDAQARKITQEDLKRVEDEVVREVVGEIEEAGLDLVTDGLIRWEDGQTRWTRSLEGFETSGLLRYFDTNTYYRQPVVTGAVAWTRPILADEIRFARETARRPVKAVVTGPFTLAVLSKDEHYKDVRRLVLALAEALNEELKSLVRAGASVVSIDEPAIARSPKSFPLFREGIRVLTRGVEALTVLQTSFGDASKLFEDLLDLPVDVVGADFTTGPAPWKALSKVRWTKGLYLGLIDARNTMREKEADLIRGIREAAKRVGAQRLQVGTSTGLEFLPREAARDKVRILARAVARARDAR